MIVSVRYDSQVCSPVATVQSAVGLEACIGATESFSAVSVQAAYFTDFSVTQIRNLSLRKSVRQIQFSSLSKTGKPATTGSRYRAASEAEPSQVIAPESLSALAVKF